MAHRLLLQSAIVLLWVFAVLLPVPPVAAQGTAGAAAAGQQAGDDIRALEAQVQIVLTEARRQQDLLAQQRQRLVVAESANGWLPWLVLGLLGLCGLALWLALRVRRLQRALTRQMAKPDSMVAGLPDAAGDVPPQALATSTLHLAPERTLLSASMAGGPPSAATELGMGMGRPPILGPDGALSLREFSTVAGVSPRPVSVEELLDLDQQVEFFLVLGQAQSAIDLLLSHVRATGGTSALPYFKLLEIYRQQGDEEAFERTRERFNQRFNAHAPDWAGDLAGGRLLEDYPEVLMRLQRAWPQPMRAVAELEGLLLRRADLEPFDLPAYREVLMLHALVRDLPAVAVAQPPLANAAAAASPGLVAFAPPAPPAPSAAAAPLPGQAAVLPPVSAPITTPAVLTRELASEPAAARPKVSQVPPQMAVREVDLLLPLGEAPLDITAPRPHLAEHGSAQAMLADWVFTRAAKVRPLGQRGASADRPAGVASRPMALDLDLSDYAPAPREFTRPAAFTDIDMRRDKRRSDLGALDGVDSSDPAPLPSRR